MKNAKIFISHSTKTSEAERYLTTIHAALEDAGYNVFLDREGLDLGDTWRAELFRWMEQSNAAVLLLSESALVSEFVSIEMSILLFRHLQEKRFPVLPVLVGDIDIENLAEGIVGQLRVGDIQCVSGDDPQAAANDVVNRLNQEWRSHGEHRSRWDILVDDVGRSLARAGFEDEVLIEAAEMTANFEVPPATYRLPMRVQFARALLTVPYATACAAIRTLGDRTLSRDAKSKLLDVLHNVTPFWVEADEAARVEHIAFHNDCECRTVALTAIDPWTARNYICRANFKPLGAGWRVCEFVPPDQEDELKSVLEQLTESLTPRIHSSRRATIGDIERKLNRMETQKRPLFLLFSWVPSPQLIRQIRQHFSTPTFFLIGKSEDLEPVRSFISELRPLEETLELEARDEYDDTVSSLDCRH